MAKNLQSEEVLNEAYDFDVEVHRDSSKFDVQIRNGDEFVEIRTDSISLSLAIDERGKMRAYVFDINDQKILYHTLV